MRLAAPLAVRDAPAARLNPVTKLGAVLILSVAVLACTDPVTPGVVLAGVLAVLPFAGLRIGAFARRTSPLLLSAAMVGVVNVMFAADTGGATLLHLGPLRLTDDSLVTGGALALRVLAVALPGVLAFATTDPTDLADSLVQQLRVPARFAIGALAAYRLMPLLGEEWALLSMARRARGVDAGANLPARIRLFAGTMFALLVGAVRRGGRLATAMDARGFDSATDRTTARIQRIRPVDVLVLVSGTALAATAVTVSVAAGTFRPLIG